MSDPMHTPSDSTPRTAPAAGEASPAATVAASPTAEAIRNPASSDSPDNDSTAVTGAPPPTATALSLRTGATMVAFTVVFVAMMAAAYQATKEPIAASLREEQLRLVNEILPPTSYDNALLDDVIRIAPTPALGNDAPVALYRARRGGAAEALVVEAAAPDGYSGRINLVVAINARGELAGVRVTSHKETPGLGDYIDPRKDKDKHTPWISQFVGVNIAQHPAAAWTVRKDGGQFAYHTGATISARAVSRAVGRTVRWLHQHQHTLYALPSGSLVEKIDE